MVNEKQINKICTIERALGMIEGVSCGVDNAIAATLIDAVEMIENAVKEIFEDGK